MRKLLALLFLLPLAVACTPSTEIHITENLEHSLWNNQRLSSYTRLLSQAETGDTNALHEFLQIDYVFDSPGYDHGDVLVHLMKKYSDRDFLNTTKKLKPAELSHLRTYMRVGFEYGCEKDTILFNTYKQSLNYIGYEDWEFNLLKHEFLSKGK